MCMNILQVRKIVEIQYTSKEDSIDIVNIWYRYMDGDKIHAQMQECLGCRTSFQENEKLSPQNMVREYKRYELPLPQKHKWLLTRAIVAFLNCKGGIILIGVSDEECLVHGIFLEPKQRDMFQQGVGFLLANIHPKIDQKEREEVQVQYVPVKSKGVFEGKYVIKIIVRQGNPSVTYVLNQKIRLQSNNKVDEFNVYYGFYRLCTGNIQELKDTQLLNQMHSKARNPIKQVEVDHECNRIPPFLEIDVYYLCFNGVANHQKVVQIFKEQLEALDVEYDIKRDKTQLKIAFQEEESYLSTKKFVCDNISELNNTFDGLYFVQVGKLGNSFVFENKPQKKIHKNTQEHNTKQKIITKINQIKNKKQEKKQYKIPQVLKENKNALFYTFTNIFTNEVPELCQMLLQYVKKDRIIPFRSSVMVLFANKQKVSEFQQNCDFETEMLMREGIQRKIFFGLNTQVIRIKFYHFGKKQQMDIYIKSKHRPQLACFVGEGRKEHYQLQLRDPFEACRSLDMFSQDREFKKRFRIPGSQHGANKKIRIYLICSP